MEEPNKQIDNVLIELKRLFSKDLLGVYLYGSYVKGGLKKDSDVDFLVIINRDMTKEEKRILISKIMPISKEIGEDTSLKYIELTVLNYHENENWSYPPIEEFIYGEWLRGDYLNYFIPEKNNNIDLTILLYQAKLSSISIYGENNINNLIPDVPFIDLQKAIKESSKELIKDFYGDETNVILTLCRMIVTYETGKFYSKDLAGSMIIENLAIEENNLISLAISSYKNGNSVDWELFPVKSVIKKLYAYLNYKL
ncbi:aminoglycoside nucleotidyltransferase ANT(9) [Staphylococcus arlettae]|nr:MULTISPECIES: aminoglycoside nucleotidyltransferase ANT(9) [Staphylococcaceae]HDF4425480.1 aminoglycoside nucleotidyltransferase ANT(9) [Staphylococcus aureus]MBO3066606.1 aminoglycoside nucleotidyltransferase ANT(9) [Staphylococcus shinii]MDT0670558.1 aminoglycoside nucleotidyltransferase ANT(9) [Mammaliicoccus sciuri]MDT0701491.1 aminoglycoside nucleotidyltransferase ANT(9) [Staphylococcus chromogenes]HDF4425705.1 aminoglycoside nucleotidyltransferase ANT(9) [Staphylococcus aureus]